MAQVTREVHIRDASIRLGQLLKLADLIDAGNEAKEVLAAGEVRVNGEVETRRGRRVVPGDLVAALGEVVAVLGPSSVEPGETSAGAP